jgi:hypothetical protein
MGDATVLTAGALGNVPTTWSIVQTGDYNDDGMSDLKQISSTFLHLTVCRYRLLVVGDEVPWRASADVAAWPTLITTSQSSYYFYPR